MNISSAYIFAKQIIESDPVADGYIFQNGVFSKKLCPVGVSLDNIVTIVGDGQVDPEGWDYYGKIWNDAQFHGSLKDYYGTNKIICLLGSDQAVPFSMENGEISRTTQVPSTRPGSVGEILASILIPAKIPKGIYTRNNYRRTRYQGWGCWGNNMCYGATTMSMYEIMPDDNLMELGTIYGRDYAAVNLSELLSQSYSDKPATSVDGQYDTDYTYGYIKIESGDIVQTKVQSIWLS